MERTVIEKALGDAVKVQRRYLQKFTDKFKMEASTKGFYGTMENRQWATGFVTGQYWLAYEFTKEDAFRKAALVQTTDFLHRIENRIDVDHHDMGMLYSLSCVAAYKLTGSQEGKRAALLAAENLLKRFRIKGSFFQAWGKLDAKEEYRMIIDCLLNLPLLYWASHITGDVKYARAADQHTKTAVKYLIRDDYSVHHTYFFDPESGAPLYGVTHQGYSDSSFWARGQAWAVCGLAFAYRNTKKEEYREKFHQVMEFFMEHIPEDGLPYWDLCFMDGEEPRDSSAAAIAVCGILEMKQYCKGGLGLKYQKYADTLLKALIEQCAVTDPSESNGVLLHGVYQKASPYNEITDYGVDECNCWGDYFYMEALMRCWKTWKPYW